MWSAVPIQVDTIPAAEAGFKYLIVKFAVENNSSYWGTLYVDVNGSYVTSESGFVYGVAQGEIPSDSPHITEHFPGQTRDDKRIFWSEWGTLTPPQRFGPGLVARGMAGALSGTDKTQMVLVFRVAETQNHFVVTLPGRANLTCIHPDGQVQIDDLALSIELDEDFRHLSYPTGRPESDFKSFDEPVEIPGVGTLVPLDIYSSDGGVLTIRFKFINSSAGYEASGEIKGYLIGDDGFIVGQCKYGDCREFGGTGLGPSFYAGPGQTSEAVVSFRITTDANTFKLALQESGRPLGIYSLPTASKISSLPLGTYVTAIYEEDYPPTFSAEFSGEWDVTFEDSGLLTIRNDNKVVVVGEYTSTGELVIFGQDNGPGSCSDVGFDTGTYEWSLSGGELIFEVVDDGCEGRVIVMTSHPFFRR